MNFKYLLITLLLLFLFFVTGLYAWNLTHTLFFDGFMPSVDQWKLYEWVAVGCLAYLPLHWLLSGNMPFFATFSHELTHIVVSLIFLRRINSFHAEQGTGEVYTQYTGLISSLSDIPVSLAPYCLPIFTYLLLFLRCLISVQNLWMFDIAIGMTVAFHLYCFRVQTASFQTDINRFPLLMSYVYIHTARLINICIIAMAFAPTCQRGVFSSMWMYLTHCWHIGYELIVNRCILL